MDGLLVALNSFLYFFVGSEGQSQRVVGLDVIGVYFKGFLEVLDSFFSLFGVQVDVGDSVIGMHIGGVGLDGSQETLLSLFVLFMLPMFNGLCYYFLSLLVGGRLVLIEFHQ